jgi:uncharacterized DUF497 family protein
MAYNRRVKFEWDDAKNISNFAKHSIWFEEAQTIWTDPHASEYFDPTHSEREDRFIRIGYSLSNRLVLVVFCERLEGTIVRIISARKATAKERKAHEERI